MNLPIIHPWDNYSTSVLNYTSIVKQAEETLRRERFRRDMEMAFQVTVATVITAGIVCLLSLALANIA